MTSTPCGSSDVADLVDALLQVGAGVRDGVAHAGDDLEGALVELGLDAWVLDAAIALSQVGQGAWCGTDEVPGGDVDEGQLDLDSEAAALGGAEGDLHAVRLGRCTP